MIKHSFLNFLFYKRKFILLFLPLIISFELFSQQDTTNALSPERKRKHSPNKAMIFSAVLPGLGQAYNKKYWKIPIVYAGMGTTLYFFNYNNILHKEYKLAYVYKTDQDPNTIDLFPHYTADDVRELSSYYRRYRDLNIILTGLIYTLNIVDAYVDAQLVTFDVSDDLSFRVYPGVDFLSQKNATPSLTLSFNL